MTNTLALKLLKTMAPVALGALGGWLAVSFPTAHAALCSGAVL